MRKKFAIVFLSLLFLISIAGLLVVHIFRLDQKPLPSFGPTETLQNQSKHSTCLSDSERADYLRVGEFVPSIPLTILIQDKNTKEEKVRFEVSDVRPSEAWPFSNHMFKCGFYVVRRFNFDLSNLKTLPGFRKEIWKYQYNGKGRKILTLSYKDENGLDQFFYSDNFRINNTETYLALIRSWYGDPEHAIVIKNLKTMEDVFVLTIKDLVEIYEKEYEGKYAFGPGTFQFSGWYQDYLTFEILNPGNPFFRLNTEIWELEITGTPFELPFEEYPLLTINLQRFKK